MTGLSRRNLHYMRGLAGTWPTREVVQQVAAQLPWGHILVLLDELPIGRLGTGTQPGQQKVAGRGRAYLPDQSVMLLGRSGGALTNFATHLPAPDSELARQLVKDPYVFDFLTLTERVADRELEDALVANLQQFLLELGHGFAFVARQYRFTVAGDDFVIDLLFFNFVQNRFVVFELKVDKFTPAHAGQLGMYVAWVQKNLAGTEHRDTIGILVCADRNAAVVHYALASATAPMAVSTYTYDQLPAQEQQALPSQADLSSIIEHPVVRGRQEPGRGLRRPARTPLPRLTAISEACRGSVDGTSASMAPRPALHHSATCLITNTIDSSAAGDGRLEHLGDPRCSDALEWLESKWLPGGGFPREAPNAFAADHVVEPR